MLCSCYKDLSTEATQIIPDIVVTGLPERLDVVYGEEIHLAVNAYMGEKGNADLKFLWEIDITAGSSKARAELGEEPSLDYVVANTPSSTAYVISVRVTDPETGLQAMKSCYLSVSSSLGEGLLVSYMLPNGKSSDFGIVASTATTYGYGGSAPRTTRGLYSLANGGVYPERINCILQTTDTQSGVYDSRRILAGSPNHVFALDPLSFEVREQDAQLFNSKTMDKFGPSTMFNFGGYGSFMFIDGQAYAHVCSIDNVYAKVANSASNPINFTPKSVGYACPDQGVVCVYNDSDGLYIQRAYQLMAATFGKIDTNGMLDFPLDGSVCLQGGCLRSMRPAFLVKDKNGAYHVVIVEANGPKDVASSVSFEGPDIEKAVSIAFCDNGDIFYYATERELYTTVISGNITQVRKLSWTPSDPGEKITKIQQYRQAWYGTGQLSASSYGYVLPTHRNMLIITTYNESTGEGKFYLRGFNVATGLFTFNGDYGTFGGFGEITAIAPTLR